MDKTTITGITSSRKHFTLQKLDFFEAGFILARKMKTVGNLRVKNNGDG